MARQHKRYKGKVRWFLLAIVVIISLFYFGRRAYFYLRALREENYLKKNILVMRAENRLLKQRVDAYRKGIFIEAKARDELGMIKKGEKIFVLKK